MTRTWKEHLEKELAKTLSSKNAALLATQYSEAFPSNFQTAARIQEVVHDIHKMECLSKDNTLEVALSKHAADHLLHLKLYQLENPIPLSDIVPILENLDLRAFNENPYEIKLGNRISIWISDFIVSYPRSPEMDIAPVKTLFEDTLKEIHLGHSENDGFNKLVLGAQLSWREISLIRAYAKYLYQTGFRFNQAYIEKTIANQSAIVKNILAFFNAKHDPHKKSSQAEVDRLEKNLESQLDAVTSLDEDRILRRFLAMIKATLRTNYFQRLPNKKCKAYISFKLDSKHIPELPLPHPLYEVFVYSPQFEAIHLRSAKVARGGIRWSDRREDFRTEILGLMKAQTVKNAVIVPAGAKGGFVLKKGAAESDDRPSKNEVIACYENFIRGLLDLTDNLKNGKVIRPLHTVCYDDDDTYLVVAADKGTSSFSDIANAISKEYQFWLGDAFASGGSTGYDHKKIGITARGAWESIKRHFFDINIDVMKTDITVVGIGDMSGDVFGNGVTYSQHIKLVAAFDHRHIFLDPNPHPEKSFQERLRLFHLPTSSWENYNAKLISAGGGVFKRSVKSIPITEQVKKILDIKATSLTPNELIQAILKAPVDLMYNGGIGTYVKASTESHENVGDKANELCRVNGNELRCKVVGEGGNLGFTQLGRVEYALNHGLINTDFIDNSGGVDCSDHEVNIKILLNREVQNGSLTEKKRNHLLLKMEKDIANSVLLDNHHQAFLLSFSADHTTKYISLYQAYIKELEVTANLDRNVEFLPDDKKLIERKAAGEGLTKPELAVLLAYTKIHIKNLLLKSDLPENPYFKSMLQKAFPKILIDTYPVAAEEHSLRREIIATQLSNYVVNTMGITFLYRAQIETGASAADIVCAHAVASNIYETNRIYELIDSLSGKIDAKTQYDFLHHVRRILNLSTRWFLRNNRLKGNISNIIEHYRKCAKRLAPCLPNLTKGTVKEYLQNLSNQIESTRHSIAIFDQIALSRMMYTTLNIIEVATLHQFDLVKTAKLYFEIGNEFNFLWFRDYISSDTREGNWNVLARLTLRDEIDILQRHLCIIIAKSNKKESDATKLITEWSENNKAVCARWKKILAVLHENGNFDYTMFFIVFREFSDLLYSEPA